MFIIQIVIKQFKNFKNMYKKLGFEKVGDREAMQKCSPTDSRKLLE